MHRVTLTYTGCMPLHPRYCTWPHSSQAAREEVTRLSSEQSSQFSLFRQELSYIFSCCLRAMRPCPSLAINCLQTPCSHGGATSWSVDRVFDAVHHHPSLPCTLLIFMALLCNSIECCATVHGDPTMQSCVSLVGSPCTDARHSMLLQT